MQVDTPGRGTNGSPSAALPAAPAENSACIVCARDTLQRKEASTLHVSQLRWPALRPLPCMNLTKHQGIVLCVRLLGVHSRYGRSDIDCKVDDVSS